MATARSGPEAGQARRRAGLPALPRHPPGSRIGLLGGSFNPPHAGHRLASLVALRRLRLDRVWWIVTPGNPLKSTAGLAPLAERLAAARRLAADPRIAVTGFEAEIGARYSYDGLAYLKRRCPGVAFVWLMGADNLTQFHHWRRWRDIAALVPIAVIDRPGATGAATSAPAAIRFAGKRFPASRALRLPTARPPAWIFLHGPRSYLSSTKIRESGSIARRPR